VQKGERCHENAASYLKTNIISSSHDQKKLVSQIDIGFGAKV
jgi:hypothetical protein